MSQLTIRELHTAADWTALNPVLGQYEMGIEIDPATGAFGKAKLGDGVTAWADLSYWNPAGSTGATKATGAEVNTGTNDTKFVTAKALVDADAAKAAATPVSADVFYFRTAAGLPKLITFDDLCTAIDGVLNP